LIKLDFSGPALYTQSAWEKTGRSLTSTSSERWKWTQRRKLREILRKDKALREEYRKFHKLTNDPRVTRFGRFLRKTSMDELPQLWNVSKGR
jgi:lipopolysaccharide/colanic/teichoic acid biosynthesis glycosyltransferase